MNPLTHTPLPYTPHSHPRSTPKPSLTPPSPLLLPSPPSGHDVMLATATRAEHVLPLIDGPGGALFVDGRIRISDEKSIMKVVEIRGEARSMIPYVCPVGREGYGHAHKDAVALQEVIYTLSQYILTIHPLNTVSQHILSIPTDFHISFTSSLPSLPISLPTLQEYELLLHESSPEHEFHALDESDDFDVAAGEEDDEEEDKDSDEEGEKDSDEEEVGKHVVSKGRQHLTSATGHRSSLATAQKVKSSEEHGRTSAGASRGASRNNSTSAGASRAVVSTSAGASRNNADKSSAGASRNNTDKSLVNSKGSDREGKHKNDGKWPLLTNDHNSTDKSKNKGKEKGKDEGGDKGGTSRGKVTSSSMLEMMSLPSEGPDHDKHTQESLFPPTNSTTTSRPTTTPTTAPPTRALPRAPPRPPRKPYTPPIEVPIHVLRRFLGQGLGQGGQGQGLGGGAGYGPAPLFPYATQHTTLDRNGLGREVRERIDTTNRTCPQHPPYSPAPLSSPPRSFSSLSSPIITLLSSPPLTSPSSLPCGFPPGFWL